MKIKRNGCEIELTDSELMEAYEEYRLECAIEDIKGLCEREEIDLSEVNVPEVAGNALNGLGKCDLYFEAYWDVFEYHLHQSLGQS